MRVRISDLAPGVNYTIRLRSTNDSETSEWSRAFPIAVASDTSAPNTPGSVVGSMTGTSFNLSWAAVTLSSDGSPANDIEFYEVLVASPGTGLTKAYRITDTKFQFTIDMNREIFGTPRAEINMSVRAGDKTGNLSSYSAVVSQINAAPANPTGITGASVPDGVSIKWSRVTDADLLGYKVYTGTTAGTQTTIEWTGTATSAIIQSVNYATDRWFKVVAFDVFETESATPPVTGPHRPNSPSSADSVAPGAVSGISATLTTNANATNTFAAVSWTAVTDVDGDLSGYIIGYRPAGATDWEYLTVDYTNTSARIDRLLPYNNYEFRIRSTDFSANYSAWSSTVTATGATNTAPSTPSAPTAVGNTIQIQVSHPNTRAAGGAMESDVTFYEVYASTTTGFTPAPANMLGNIAIGPATTETFPIPASATSGTSQTWYVKVIAVDSGGIKSAASAQATVAATLIGTTNIGDATITNAKIGSVAADKIVAGTGIINALTVKNDLTLGDAATNGAIQSYDYTTSAGATGFRIDKNSIVIKSGQIEAAALKIQQGHNIAPAMYAAFEGTAQSIQLMYRENALVAADPNNKKFGSQSMLHYWNISATAGTRTKVFIGTSATDYNTPVEGGKSYIVSAYASPDVNGGGRDTKLVVRHSNGTFYTVATGTPPANTFTRLQGVWVAPADGYIIGVIDVDANFGTANTLGALAWDGWQVEERWGSISNASPWTPPGINTSLDGGIIRTGEIRSNQNVEVAGAQQPSWSINTAGNAQIGDVVVRGKVVVGVSGEAPKNICANGGTFTGNVNGYSAAGTLGTALSHTTTPGEVITGAGSAKMTANPGTKTSSFSCTINRSVAPGSRIRISFAFKTNGTATDFLIQRGTTSTSVSGPSIIPSPIQPNVLYNISIEVVAGDDGQTTTIGFVMQNTTSTVTIIDDFVVQASDEMGKSYVSSANFVEGDSGYRIYSDGYAEFNSGVFRGELGVGSIKAANISSEIVLASTLKTAITGRRTEYGPNGLQVYDSDESIIIDFSSDPARPSSMAGDFLASSMTVTDQIAIRGQTNELSKGSIFTIQTGTTAPQSPPTVSVGYENWNTDYTGSFGVSFNPYRYGWAWDANNYGGCWIATQDIYGSSAFIQRYDRNTGAPIPGASINLNLPYTAGGLTVLGNTVYVIGLDSNNVWRILGIDINSGGILYDFVYADSTPRYIPVIGNDGTNIIVAYVKKADNNVRVKTVNATTGAGVSDLETNLNIPSGTRDLSYVGRGSFDFGSTKIVVARRYIYMYVLNTDGTRTLGSTSLDFSSPANISGAAWADLGSGNRFYTHDASAARIYRHTNATWVGAINDPVQSTWYAGNTWYDSNAAGTGTHETQMGPARKFTMTKRAMVTVTTAPLPQRPTPNTNDDAVATRVYMTRNSGSPTNASYEKQFDLADGQRTVSYYSYGGGDATLPAPNGTGTVPPPTTNGFIGLAASNSLIKTVNEAWRIYGDGSGNWGVISVDTFGAITFNNGFISASLRETQIKYTDSTVSTTLSTTPVAMGARGGSGTFIAPPSGIVSITWSGHLRTATAGSVAYLGVEVRTGATVGSGTSVLTHSANDSLVNANAQVIQASIKTLLTGITPGATYNIRQTAFSSSASVAATFGRGVIHIAPQT